MRKRIFSGIFCTCLSVMLVCIFVVTGFLYTYYTDRQTESLTTELKYMVHMVETHSDDHIMKLATPRGILITDSDGSVLVRTAADNAPVADDSTVRELLSLGGGCITKHTSTLRKTITVGEVLSDGRLICITDTHHSLVSLLFSMYGYVLIVLGVATVLSLLLARVLSRSILKPVNELDLSSPHRTKVYPELQPLIQKIDDQNAELLRRIQSKEAEHEEQDKLRREFTANVSHELKTPLTSISGYAEIIRDGLVQPADVPVFAGRIYDESQRMITLVGDIIKLSQLDDKEISVTIERINLLDCCRAVVSSLESQARKKGITIELEGDSAEISGAEVIIYEIVHNIVDNAIKYNKPNGSVSVFVRQCIDGVELTVTDTGIGIPKDSIDHVFERFYRADKSHSKEIGGTGLGLSIVKHGAMFHNAYVSLTSEEGVGTTVRILF